MASKREAEVILFLSLSEREVMDRYAKRAKAARGVAVKRRKAGACVPAARGRARHRSAQTAAGLRSVNAPFAVQPGDKRQPLIPSPESRRTWPFTLGCSMQWSRSTGETVASPEARVQCETGRSSRMLVPPKVRGPAAALAQTNVTNGGH